MRQEKRDPEVAFAEGEGAPAGEPSHERLAEFQADRRRQMPTPGREDVAGKRIHAQDAGARAAAERAEQIAIGRDADRGQHVALEHVAEGCHPPHLRPFHRATLSTRRCRGPVGGMDPYGPVCRLSGDPGSRLVGSLSFRLRQPGARLCNTLSGSRKSAHIFVRKIVRLYGPKQRQTLKFRETGARSPRRAQAAQTLLPVR